MKTLETFAFALTVFLAVFLYGCVVVAMCAPILMGCGGVVFTDEGDARAAEDVAVSGEGSSDAAVVTSGTSCPLFDGQWPVCLIDEPACLSAADGLPYACAGSRGYCNQATACGNQTTHFCARGTCPDASYIRAITVPTREGPFCCSMPQMADGG